MERKNKAAKAVNIALGLIVILAVVLASPLFGFGRGIASREQRMAAASPVSAGAQTGETAQPNVSATPRPTAQPTPTPVVLPTAPPAPGSGVGASVVSEVGIASASPPSGSSASISAISREMSFRMVIYASWFCYSMAITWNLAGQGPAPQ